MNENQDANIARQLKRLTILVSITLLFSGIVAVTCFFSWMDYEQPYQIPNMWVAAAHDLQTGHILQTNDITIMASKMGEGFPLDNTIQPEHKFLVFGHILERPVSKGEPITTDALRGVITEE